MTMLNDPFKFDFSKIQVSDNPIQDAPRNVPLPATIKNVEYKDLAKKGSGESKPRLIITQEVMFDDKVGRFETIISPNQGYILKGYLLAVDVDADALSGQPMDEEGLQSTLVGSSVALTLEDREWNGKTFLNFKRVASYDNAVVDDNEQDLPF